MGKSPLPLTNVRTSHALTIRANGVTVGLINGWDNSQGRTITPVFEVDVDDSGNPVENVPGNANGLTLTISRYDTYPIRMEDAFGTPDLVMLTRQNRPFDLFEVWSIPVSIQSLSKEPAVLLDTERYVYTNCWFSSLGRTLRADDNRIVNVNASIVYAKKVKVTGIISGIVN